MSEPSPFYESAFLDVRLVPHDLEGCDDLARMHQPVGTGPFRFTAPPHGNRILIERAPHYRQSVDGATLPYLDAIEIQQAESPAAAIARLGNGDLDIYFPASRDWDRVVDVSGSRIRPAESLKSLDLDAAAFSSRNDLKQFGLWLSNADGPLRDRRVREAIARSIDRPALVAASDRVLTAPAGRFFDSRVLGFDPSAPSIEFDPARAQALLAEAGHPGGAGLRPLVFGTMEHAKVGEVLVQQLARAGLHASIVKIARGDVMRLLQDGSVDALLATNNSAIRGGEWGAVLLDLQPGRTADPVLVPFERELASTQERADRAGVYKRIEAKLLWELPAVPIAWVDSDRPYYVFVLRRKVHGFNDPVTGYARLPDLGNAWLAR